MKKPLLIAITGPTASGKTALAVELAKKLKTVVLNFDSRQFYAEMQIGTARPSLEELEGIPHYFLGDRSIHQSFSAADYALEAQSLLNELFQKYPIVIVVGGSGLYLKALTEGLPYMPPIPDELRNEIVNEYKEKGLAWLQAEVKLADEDFFNIVDVANYARLIRALEVIRVSGKPFTYFRNQKKGESNFELLEYFIEWPRELLYNRINLRVNLMMEAGLLQEVENLQPYKHLNALHTVGYTELFQYLDGNCSLEEAVMLIQQHTRNYAKRQTTWFLNKHKGIRCVDAELQSNELMNSILNSL